MSEYNAMNILYFQIRHSELSLEGLEDFSPLYPCIDKSNSIIFKSVWIGVFEHVVWKRNSKSPQTFNNFLQSVQLSETFILIRILVRVAWRTRIGQILTFSADSSARVLFNCLMFNDSDTISLSVCSNKKIIFVLKSIDKTIVQS